MVAWNEIGDDKTQSTEIDSVTNLPFMGRRMFSRYLTPFPAPLRRLAEGKASGECVAGKTAFLLLGGGLN